MARMPVDVRGHFLKFMDAPILFATRAFSHIPPIGLYDIGHLRP
jgi:hypothetical protein